MPDAVGVVGLGNMGAVLAGNLVGVGLRVVAHDVAGPERCPAGAEWASSVDELVPQVDVMVLSLPDGAISTSVVEAIATAGDGRLELVIDTSTTGPDAAESITAMLAAAGVEHVDAPVSGGLDGARARTLMVMFSGSDAACELAAPVLAGLSDRRRRVGDRPGMAQAMKLANNFLSAVALAATSEAIAFGRSAGLDIEVMLDVLAASSGRNAAVDDKFPNHVVTGRYSSGFANTLMAKDVRLYLDAVCARQGAHALGQVTAAEWSRFAAADPDADFTRIFPFVAGDDPTA